MAEQNLELNEWPGKVRATLKTIEGWHRFAEETGKSGWDDYCRPGERVGEDVYDYFLDIVPPRSMSAGYLQVGEPHSHHYNPETGKFQATYATFGRIPEDEWMYYGNCFAEEIWPAETYREYDSIREFLKDTYRELEFVGMTVRRPKVICKDGFSISVQAGRTDYCWPRENLPDGNYESCELGYPNQVEELILEYAEDRRKPKNTVYVRVPVEIIDRMIQKHGGFYDGRVPHVS